MKPRLPLSTRVLAISAVNLVLLAALLVLFVRYGLGMDFNQILFAPAQDRAVEVGRNVARELEEISSDQRNTLMARYRETYGADFYLFLNGGDQIAGPVVKLPRDVAEELVRQPAQGPGGEPGGPVPPFADDKGPPRFRMPGDGKARGGRGQQRPGLFQMQAGGIYWVGVRMPVPADDGGRPRRGTVLIAAKSFYGTPLFFNILPWLGAVGAAILICAVCWLPFISSLTKTVTQVTRATQQIAEGHFEHHLPEDRPDELGQLSASINRMAARLSGFVTGQKRFLGDIAHELCAPLARIEFGMGILENRAEPADRGAVADVQEEVRHMSGLVSELLSFSRAGIQTKKPSLAPVPVADVAAEAVSREAGGDQVQLHISPDVVALADRASLSRSISNLVRNSLRYAGHAGPITVSAQRDRDHVVIRVQDSGPGLPPDELEKVFAPFYRPELSRSRESGGAGLGLAIVKTCVEACSGSVMCRNRAPSGLEVEIRLNAA